MIKLRFTIACLLICSVAACTDTPKPTEASIAITRLKELAKGDADKLTADMDGFDYTYTNYRSQKESGAPDIDYATRELSAFINHRYTQLIKTNPAEANLLLDFINSEIKFLKEEFKPNEKFKECFMSIIPPINPGGEHIYSGMPAEMIKDPAAKSEYITAVKKNELNSNYNARQLELWAFFEYIETAKKHNPAFEPITDAGCDLAEARMAANTPR